MNKFKITYMDAVGNIYVSEIEAKSELDAKLIFYMENGISFAIEKVERI